MPKPEIVIIRHFSRACLVVSTSCQWCESYGEVSKFQGVWLSCNDPASERGPEEDDPASASTGLDAGLLEKGGRGPLCFLCLAGHGPHTQQLVSQGCLGVYAV